MTRASRTNRCAGGYLILARTVRWAESNGGRSDGARRPRRVTPAWKRNRVNGRRKRAGTTPARSAPCSRSIRAVHRRPYVAALSRSRRRARGSELATRCIQPVEEDLLSDHAVHPTLLSSHRWRQSPHRHAVARSEGLIISSPAAPAGRWWRGTLRMSSHLHCAATPGSSPHDRWVRSHSPVVMTE